MKEDYIYFAFMMHDTRIITLKRIKGGSQGEFHSAKNWVARKNKGEVPNCGSWGWSEEECLKRLHETPKYFNIKGKQSNKPRFMR